VTPVNLTSIRRKDLGVLAALLLLGCILFAPLFFGGKTLHRGDHSNYGLPFFHWMHERYSQDLPVGWAQGMGNGEPVLDALVTLNYYPPTRILTTLLNPVLAYNLNFMGHLVLAAWGIYLLALTRGRSRDAAFLGALVGGFAGGMFFVLEWYMVVVTMGWVPWMLLGLKILQDKSGHERWFGGVVLGLAVGLGFSGGYSGMVAYAMLPLGLLYIHWLWKGDGSGMQARLKASSGPLALAVLLAALLAAGPVMGLKRLSEQSQRGKALSIEASAVNSLSPTALAQAVAPHAFGKMENDSYLGASWRFGTHFPDGMLLYFGIGGLLLALAGLRSRQADRTPLLVAVVVLIIYGLGRWTPLYSWFIQLPILSHLRAPSKAVALCTPLVALWVADGWDSLRGPAGRGIWIVGAVLGTGLLLAGLVLFAAETKLLSLGSAYIEGKILTDPLKLKSAVYYTGKLSRWMFAARSHLLWQGLLGLLSAAAIWGARRSQGRVWMLILASVLFTDLCINGRSSFSTVDESYYSHVPPAMERVMQEQAASKEPFKIFVWGRGEQLLRAFPSGRYEGDLEGELRYAKLPSGNQPLVYGLQQFNGYTPSMLRRYRYLTGWIHDDRPADLDEQTSKMLKLRRLWDLGAVRYVLSSRALNAPNLNLIQKDGTWLYENTRALPMAYFAEQVQTGISDSEAFKALTDPVDPRQSWSRPALLEMDGSEQNARGKVQWIEKDDHRWSLDVEAGPGGGTLVFSRIWYPATWRASVDGKPAALQPANAGYSALRVPQGAHRILVEFHDPGQPWGMLLFFAAFLISAAVLLKIFLALDILSL
jgi:hypothetical protein